MENNKIKIISEENKHNKQIIKTYEKIGVLDELLIESYDKFLYNTVITFTNDTINILDEKEKANMNKESQKIAENIPAIKNDRDKLIQKLAKLYKESTNNVNKLKSNKIKLSIYAKEEREKTGKTVREFAQFRNVSKSQISKFETGYYDEKVSLPIAKSFCNIYKVTYSNFLKNFDYNDNPRITNNLNKKGKSKLK